VPAAPRIGGRTAGGGDRAARGRYPVAVTLDLARLRARLPTAPRTRFAPAPTGHLHLGHVANAVMVWGLARTLGGTVVLRVEDHDRQRCTPAFEAALLDDLDWLGFAADAHPTAELRAGRTAGRQSDREAAHRAAAAALASAGWLFGCACTRRDIEAARPPREAAGEGPFGPELRYPGRCRARGLPLDDAHGWRLRIDPGVETFDDAALGPQRQDPAAQCGDLLVRDRLGNWTYQFAVTVDDRDDHIDLVVRGTDLLASTGRQVRLARLLGREQPPVFLHHGLLMKSPTQKLSKSDGDTGIADLRRAGWTAERVIGHAAWRLGLTERDTPLPANEVAAVFTGAGRAGGAGG
jgi:glutamyl/glutaminyl-tRNA synthetase